MRASRSRYAGADRLELAERGADVVAGRACRGSSRRAQPGLATGSNVGFGMKRLTLPPTSSRCLPSISAHCIARLRDARVEVAGEGVGRLVVVVVGVEQLEAHSVERSAMPVPLIGVPAEWNQVTDSWADPPNWWRSECGGRTPIATSSAVVWSASEAAADSWAWARRRPLLFPPPDLRKAVSALVRAFWDYPETCHLLPAADARRRVLPRYLGCDCADAQSYGTLLGVEEDGRFVGAAAWLPPDGYPISTRRQLRQLAHLAPALPWCIGSGGRPCEGAAPRAIDTRPSLTTSSDRSASSPITSGPGVGGALLAPILERADVEGVGCYLTTREVRERRLLRPVRVHRSRRVPSDSDVAGGLVDVEGSPLSSAAPGSLGSVWGLSRQWHRR